VTESNSLDRLQGIFRDVLRQPDLILTRGSSAKTVKDWDSLAHVDLLWNIEHEFSVRFALGETQDLKNVGELMDLLEQKLARKR
jgi:acyl carrier protein